MPWFLVIGWPFRRELKESRKEVIMALELCRASRDERRRHMTGDELVPHPMGAITHAITIDAPPAAVWPWLVQMGSGRAGWYAYDHIDNDGMPSARCLMPELQHVAVGDVMPWLPGAREGFIVREVVPERALVLVEPLQPATASSAAASDTSFSELRASWVLVLQPLAHDRTRLITRARLARDWLAPQSVDPILSRKPIFIERVYSLLATMPRPLMLLGAGFGHYLMESRMLRGIKRRAERRSGQAVVRPLATARSTPSRVRSSVPTTRVLRIVNPLVSMVLRSPLHGLLSSRVLLLSYIGRKTGKQFTIPVGYTREGATLTLFSAHAWWKNLRGDRRVALRLQGRERTGHVEVIEDHAAVLDEAEQLVAKYGLKEAGRRIGLALDARHSPSRTELAAAMQNRVAIRLILDPLA